MTLRPTPIALGEYYHIYSRGVDKRNIFMDKEDERRFIRLLYLCNGSIPIVYRDTKKMTLSLINKGDAQTAIGAYCLMSNHFHILAKETKEFGISKFISKLLTAYSKYFNKKYERTGALFGSEFKSEHLSTDEYLKYIFSYIHLNPLKIIEPDWKKNGMNSYKAEQFLGQYYGSSYPDYSGSDREESLILNKLAFPEYFSNSDDFKKEINDWLSYPHLAKARGWRTVDNQNVDEVIE